MKIALIGYGKMGKAIEKLASESGHSIIAKIGSNGWDVKEVEEADLCMEFTSPECAWDNITRLLHLNKNIVIGTTGWEAQLCQLQQLIHQYDVGVLYSSNFSIGVQLFFEIINHASRLMATFLEYDVAGIEYHHKQKKDAPSGTALMIAKMIEKNIGRIEKLPLSAIRCGSLVGTHTTLFDSPFDTITLQHEAKNRDGFAKGAIQAAEWLMGKKGLYTFSDCIQDLVKRR